MLLEFRAVDLRENKDTEDIIPQRYFVDPARVTAICEFRSRDNSQSIAVIEIESRGTTSVAVDDSDKDTAKRINAALNSGREVTAISEKAEAHIREIDSVFEQVVKDSESVTLEELIACFRDLKKELGYESL